MNCSEVQELFGIYFDLPEHDNRRKRTDDHVRICEACREEFLLWEESNDLIRSVQDEPLGQPIPSRISGSVMERIYRDEAWRIPVKDKMYAIPYRIRRKLTAVIAMCLAVFAVSLVYSLMGGGADAAHSSELAKMIVEPRTFSAENSTDVETLSHSLVASNVPMAPMGFGGVTSAPDYWLIVSVLGLASTLLIMNWLSRTHS